MRETMLPGRDAAPRLTSYEDERARYRVQVPERFNAVLDIVDRPGPPRRRTTSRSCRSARDGETVAEQTVADIAAESRRVANALIELGIRAGRPGVHHAARACPRGTRRCSA